MNEGIYLDEEEKIDYDDYKDMLYAYGFNNLYNLKSYVDAAEIVRKKKVDLNIISKCNTAFDYNNFPSVVRLDNLEFVLVQAWLEGDV